MSFLIYKVCRCSQFVTPCGCKCQSSQMVVVCVCEHAQVVLSVCVCVYYSCNVCLSEYIQVLPCQQHLRGWEVSFSQITDGATGKHSKDTFIKSNWNYQHAFAVECSMKRMLYVCFLCDKYWVVLRKPTKTNAQLSNTKVYQDASLWKNTYFVTLGFGKDVRFIKLSLVQNNPMDISLTQERNWF